MNAKNLILDETSATNTANLTFLLPECFRVGQVYVVEMQHPGVFSLKLVYDPAIADVAEFKP